MDSLKSQMDELSKASHCHKIFCHAPWAMGSNLCQAKLGLKPKVYFMIFVMLIFAPWHSIMFLILVYLTWQWATIHLCLSDIYLQCNAHTSCLLFLDNTISSTWHINVIPGVSYTFFYIIIVSVSSSFKYSIFIIILRSTGCFVKLHFTPRVRGVKCNFTKQPVDQHRLINLYNLHV